VLCHARAITAFPLLAIHQSATRSAIWVPAMSEHDGPYNVSPAGYLLLREVDDAATGDAYRKNFGPYAGVDRLPSFFPPDATIRQAIGEPPIHDIRLHASLEEWFGSRFGNTAFISGREQAFRLFMAFGSFGFRLELASCQLAWVEGEEERLKSYGPTDEASPVVSQTYGFDISWPTCNHSAILQPGVVPSSQAWRSKLNEHGLLDRYEDASRLRQEYLVTYPYPPFDIYLVRKVCASSDTVDRQKTRTPRSPD
jgi:hypothetical protein